MSLVNETCAILSNEQVGPRLYIMTVEAPLIAGDIKPGQFVHMHIPGMEGHILRRPFSVYAVNEGGTSMDILYQVVGYGSDHMTTLKPGVEVELIGPIGTPWSFGDIKHALVVGGGVGAAPVFMLVEQLKAAGIQTEVVLGAATKDAMVCRERYTALLGGEPICATDDGSYGHAGFCTEPVKQAIAEAAESGNPYDYLAVCGPEPLMKIVSGIAAEAGVPCQISMEKRMACGVGACLSCVVDTVNGKKRACVDGPVFNAEEVVW